MSKEECRRKVALELREVSRMIGEMTESTSDYVRIAVKEFEYIESQLKAWLNKYYPRWTTINIDVD